MVSPEQLQEVMAAYQTANETKQTALMVGLNRRFSPMALQLREFFASSSSKNMIYRVNSGHIPSTSWLHMAEEGGGMLVGEMCHFIDMMLYISNESPVRVFAQKMTVHNDTVADTDNVTIVISFDGGSLGTLCYNTVGDKSTSKERLEVYGDGRVGILDDFRQLDLYNQGKRTRVKTMNQDKGQANQIEATVLGFRQRVSPMPYEHIIQGMQVVFAAQESLRTGMAVQPGVEERENVMADA